MTEIKMTVLELLFLCTHQCYWSVLKNIRSLFRMVMFKEEERTNKQINQQTTPHLHWFQGYSSFLYLHNKLWGIIMMGFSTSWGDPFFVVPDPLSPEEDLQWTFVCKGLSMERASGMENFQASITQRGPLDRDMHGPGLLQAKQLCLCTTESVWLQQ